MKVSGMLWAGLVALSLAGCATRGPAVDSPVLRDPEAQAAAQASQATRAAWLDSQADWSFSGRVAVSANGKGGSGRIDWEQVDARYEVATVRRSPARAGAWPAICKLVQAVWRDWRAEPVRAATRRTC
jgi:outer membrane biogenesis lipoprotein LolB